ncbi:uncharacterized protein J3D65DRAFT_326340 [Phyllosticta citribraziliensis]|uniref:Uncharacterized protein n=1 Tax=Phyllosticta citribraziliensis TaxID=989973 RepID=A0ABR1LTB2_9PEZI
MNRALLTFDGLLLPLCFFLLTLFTYCSDRCAPCVLLLLLEMGGIWLSVVVSFSVGWIGYMVGWLDGTGAGRSLLFLLLSLFVCLRGADGLGDITGVASKLNRECHLQPNMSTLTDIAAAAVVTLRTRNDAHLR